MTHHNLKMVIWETVYYITQHAIECSYFLFPEPNSGREVMVGGSRSLELKDDLVLSPPPIPGCW